MTDSRSRAGVVSAIERVGVVAVIRLTDASAGRDVARALADGGVTALEVTMTVPRAIDLIDEAGGNHMSVLERRRRLCPCVHGRPDRLKMVGALAARLEQ